MLPGVAIGVPFRSAAGGYVAPVTQFDGAFDYMLRGGGLTGAVDTGKIGTLCCRLKMNGGDGLNQNILAVDGFNFRFYRDTGNKLHLRVKNTTGTIILELRNDASFVADSFHTILMAWDMSVSNKSFLYLDGVDVTTRDIHTLDETCDYTQPDWAFGAGTGGTQKLNGCIENFGFHQGYVDITDAAERAKFYDAAGNMKDPGADGSNYFGAQPLVMLQNPFDSFQQNTGSGGNFTVTGALEVCS